ncbi:hypothetical protein F383_11785 [Gossypium arboreum]|uniref:Uncharacterized protein n=1 Tax=Gossypium arboreum TaxID=29729 RepID=A0A0B0PPT0_GOSAR|nr:hypothetical protein F383_11785 [Gossypium arboreum]
MKISGLSPLTPRVRLWQQSRVRGVTFSGIKATV